MLLLVDKCRSDIHPVVHFLVKMKQTRERVEKNYRCILVTAAEKLGLCLDNMNTEKTVTEEFLY